MPCIRPAGLKHVSGKPCPNPTQRPTRKETHHEETVGHAVGLHDAALVCGVRGRPRDERHPQHDRPWRPAHRSGRS